MHFRSPWNWFKEAFTNGNLFGEEACLHLDPMVKIDVIEEETIELEVHNSLELGQGAPRSKYPLVLVANSGNSRLTDVSCPISIELNPFSLKKYLNLKY